MRLNPLRFVSPAVLFTELLSRTLRFTQEGLAEGERERKKGPLVVPFWHDELFPLIHLHRNQGVVAVVSQSRDGEFLSQVMTRFGFQLARGSSRRGGVAALIAARREMRSRNADVVVTVDGPKGPRHKVKEGAVYLASKAGAPLVPLRVYMSRSFVFQKSWDKFQVPWPGARCRVVYGKPYRVPPVMSAEETVAECLRLEATLNTLGS
ncbi:lysophospholipid acyltransferase family protein [Desulfonatronum thioautotrophicum]|uniref:lysophospholipid acyltransferase family protein n=1 Tax=Desulfonatronum thioautotrophicum TaxID=617001 RepID=UPI0005EB79D4|nr:lysophospholipid acyltransferase family protein [Desulfonatronum thioautotrophicum]